jgi:large subunit ribosomal protein LP0
MQRIRTSLRKDAVLLMGKKTMMRKAIRDHIEQNPRLEALLPHVKGNVGFVFTDKDPAKVREQLTSLKVSAPAKAGSTAPNDVIVPAGNTGLEPTQTSFLQALNIASKINKGQVEIMQDVQLLKKGDKVGASEATLLSKLNIKPFLYGLVPRVVYEDGFVFDQKVLDMTDDDVFSSFSKGVSCVAALGLAIGYPTIATVPHSLSRGFRNLVAFSLENLYGFKQADRIKEILANPGAHAAPAAAAPAGGKGGKPDAKADADKKKKEEEERKKKEEEAKKAEEEEDTDMGLDLFG